MLPIRKVVLYKHGVGYFERQGSVDGDAALDLSFRASEMNDVLKSLTTLDLTSGHIASISYESTTPLAKQLEDIAIRLPEQNAFSGLLGDVKGARLAVEVAGERVEGIAAGIETIARHAEGVVVTSHQLALLVGGRSLRTFDLQEMSHVEFLDEAVRKDLQHLLEILIGAKKKDLKKLTIFAQGEGPREILASYIVETPVWKTSYRVLLPDEAHNKGALIQGWALVDNTQDEDWENVELSLVAGLPISFIHDLYSPRYKRRPIVRVQEEEAYAPPQLEAAESGYDLDDMDMAFAADEEMAEAGFGAPAGAPMRRSAMKKEDRSEARARSNVVQTRTVEVGDLFEYAIENPVTVKRNQSALVPILQGGFDGKRVAVYNPEIREKNPMSSVLFNNTTGMTLEGGPLTVLEQETYVGEAMLDTMKPDEERLVPYSVELGCVISIDHRSRLEDVRRASVVNGSLHLYRYRISKKIYVINNKGTKDIDLFLEHRFTHGWELVETPEPVERTENFYRFRFNAPAAKTVKFEVSEKGDESQTFGLGGLGRDVVGTWLKQRYIDDATRAILIELITLQEQIAEFGRQVQERERLIQEIFENQGRLRENLKALGDSQHEKKLREQYVSEMSRDEDRLKTFRGEIKAWQESLRGLEQELRKRTGAVRYDVAL